MSKDRAKQIHRCYTAIFWLEILYRFKDTQYQYFIMLIFYKNDKYKPYFFKAEKDRVHPGQVLTLPSDYYRKTNKHSRTVTPIDNLVSQVNQPALLLLAFTLLVFWYKSTKFIWRNEPRTFLLCCSSATLLSHYDKLLCINFNNWVTLSVKRFAIFSPKHEQSSSVLLKRRYWRNLQISKTLRKTV